GIYYPSDSLKAQLCVEGWEKLYRLCKDNGIPHRCTGKLVIATDERERLNVLDLYRQGDENGVEGLRLVDAKEIRELEPNCLGDFGLFSPTAGIVDSH